jgi:hypothetical protein
LNVETLNAKKTLNLEIKIIDNYTLLAKILNLLMSHSELHFVRSKYLPMPEIEKRKETQKLSR